MTEIIKAQLRFPKIDVEHTGMAKPEVPPRRVRLLCEEDVSLFQPGHDVGMPFDFLITNAFAIDHLNHTNEIEWQALKGDNRIPWSHIALKPIRYHSTLHIQSILFCSLPVRVESHPRCGYASLADWRSGLTEVACESEFTGQGRSAKAHFRGGESRSSTRCKYSNDPARLLEYPRRRVSLRKRHT